MKRLALLISALTTLSACSVSAGNTQKLTGNTWKLTAMDGQTSAVFAEEGDSFTLTFQPDGREFSGVGSCNLLFGRCKVTGKGRIKIKPVGMTRMLCHDDGLEEAFLDMLEKADRYRFDNGALELLSHGKRCASFEAYTADEETAGGGTPVVAD